MKATKELPVAEVRSQLAELLNEVHYAGKSIVVTRRGRPLAAIVPHRLLKRLEELEDRLDVLEAREALKEPGQYSLDDIKAELGIKTNPKAHRNAKAGSTTESKETE
ncbi:hypothetical protein GCM10023187_06330 [Nibrella viscosa]|uniref:Antitoxin n=1 Tax=Nibrella viscosa TaxID=1084524 RepID=A0ABP8JXN1_9BACT